MRSTLIQLERIIERGEAAAIESGEALMQIRDNKLYKRDHSSFESYLKDRWKMSRARSYQLIELFRLSTVVDISGLAERHVREIGKLPRITQAEVVRSFRKLPENQQTTKAIAEIAQLHQQPLSELKPLERTPIGWYGGKGQLCGMIAALLPPHKVYVEPFFGGGSVLFAKEASKVEIIADKNHHVVNFFAVLRNEKTAIELQRRLTLTPYSREEHTLCLDATPTSDPIEDARRFFVRVRQSYSSIEGNSWSMTLKARTPRSVDAANVVDRMTETARRLRTVQIESRCFKNLMPKCDVPNSVIYCDPTYPMSTRKGNGDGYMQEMSDEDHDNFLEIVTGYRMAHVVISGYRCKKYDAKLKDWNRTDVPVITKAADSRKANAASRTECLWRNF